MMSTPNFYRLEIAYSELPYYNAPNPSPRRPQRLLPRLRRTRPRPHPEPRIHSRRPQQILGKMISFPKFKQRV